MRALLTFAIIAFSAGVAMADADVVFGPVSTDGNAKAIAAVKAALGKAGVGTLSAKTIEVVCATDPGCIATAGAEVGAQRALAVTVTGSGKSMKIGVLLIDIPTKLVIGTRDLEIAETKVARALGPAVKKFVADARSDRAKAIFVEGNQHFNLGEFAPALERYKTAYRILPLAAFQFNIAQCHRKLGQYKEAIAMYQNYLGGVPDASNRALVEQLITESNTAIAEEQMRLDADAGRNADVEKTKAEEARKAREAEAFAAAEKHKAEQARIAADRERYDRHPARKWGYLSAGLGLATTGAGVFFVVRERNLQSSFDSAGCGDRSRLLTADAITQCRDERDQGERAALFGNIGIAAGGAFLVTAALLLLTDPGNVERPDQARAQVSVTPTSIQAVIRW
jgi:tetratricopeptide (TPR) repeat protein